LLRLQSLILHDSSFPKTVYALAMVGHLKNVSPTSEQTPSKSTDAEFCLNLLPLVLG
jgi:hypothetical protein